MALLLEYIAYTLNIIENELNMNNKLNTIKKLKIDDFLGTCK